MTADHAALGAKGTTKYATANPRIVAPATIRRVITNGETACRQFRADILEPSSVSFSGRVA